MGTNIHKIMGFIGGIIAFVGFVPYIVSMVRGKNKPNRASWAIWSVMGFVILGTYYASGARNNLPATVALATGPTATFLFTLRYGKGGDNSFDRICIIGAIVSILPTRPTTCSGRATAPTWCCTDTGRKPITPRRRKMNIRTLSVEQVIAVVELVPFLSAFWQYNRKAVNKESAPSKATWALWVFTSILNAFSYTSLSGDLVKATVGIVDAFACTVTFFVVLRYHGTTKLTRNEKIALAIGLTALGAWYLFRQAFYANAILQVAVIVSFMPPILHTWKEPWCEPKTPWFLWTLVYISNFVLVLVRHKSWHDLVYPVNYIVLHGAVWLLAARAPKQEMNK